MNPDRPLVAVSSCLLGQRVRYDGDHKRDHYIAEVLSQQFEWKPLCPEAGAGLGVPREPIQLVGDARHPRAVRVSDTGVDLTAMLSDFARAMRSELADVDGYIFKSRSPSCGLHDARLVDSGGIERGSVSGIYAQQVQDMFPGLPVIDELQLQEPAQRQRFMERVFARWRERARP